MSALALAHSAAFARYESEHYRAEAMERYADELLESLRKAPIEQAAGDLQLCLESNPTLALAACRIVIKASRGEYPQADALRLFMDAADEHGEACVKAAEKQA